MKQTLPAFILVFLFLIVPAATLSAQNCTTAPEAPNVISGASAPCSGAAVTYQVDAVSGATSYTWQTTNDWSVIAGQGTTTVTIQAGSNAAELSVLAENACGASAAMRLQVQPATRPESPGAMVASTELACTGSTITLTVPAVSSASMYTWHVPQDWMIRSGQGTTSITAIVGSTGGVEVYATNACGAYPYNYRYFTTASSVFTNTITGVGSVCEGDHPGTLTGSTPTCTGDYTYQWESSTDGTNFISIANATSRDCAPGKLYIASWFRRRVTPGATGTSAAYSNVLKVTINPRVVAPRIDNVTISAGAQATLRVLDPIPNITYYWYNAQGEPLGKGTTLVTSALLADTDLYVAYIAVGEQCESYRSKVTVTVQQPSVPRVAEDVTVCAGTAATLTITQPYAALTYNWYAAATGGTPLTTGTTYTTPLLTSGKTYYVQVGGGASTESRSPVTVTVIPSLANNTISGNQQVCAGTVPAALTGVAPTGGNGTYTYQWQSSTNGTSFSPAAGTNNLQNYTPSLLAATTWFRRVVVSAAACNESISNTISVLVSPAIINNTIRGNQTLCADTAPAQLTGSVPAGGDGSYVYQWEYSADGVQFAPVQGANTQSFTPDHAGANAWYRRQVVSGTCAVSISDTVKITLATPEAPQVAEAGSACAGETITLRVLQPDPALTYKWYRSLGEASIAEGATVAVTVLQADTLYSVQAIRGACKSYYGHTWITVMPQPNKPVIMQQEAVLTADVAGARYEWLKDGQLLSDTAVSQSVTITAAGQYKVRVQSKAGCYSDYSEPLQATFAPTGITEEAAKAGITMVPNPTSGRIVLYARQPLKQVKISVQNLVGKDVYRHRQAGLTTQQELDLSHLPNGLYLLRIQADGVQAVQKLLLAH
ncbi:T9SS type A sorting domain-containing protein [Pontibacter chitinilyticus]|uniref:Ig-like domain-containing protein n=1 Tax=Pontibacter chitinilyticus TaxID=2674989 RepID=UPI00321A19CE